MPEPTRDELDLAERAQDGARKQYAGHAKAALAAGLAATYTVQPGDTYESIAKAVYGDEKHAADVFDASLSSGAVSSDRKVALPGGTVLTLPVVAGHGQPSAEAARDVSTAEAARQPVGDRPRSTGPAREGGVGDTSQDPAPKRAARPSRSGSARRPASRRSKSRA